MASYSVNPAGVAHARELIEKRQYVLDSEWGEVQPKAADENAYLEKPLVGRVRRLAPRPHRGRQRRDEGALRVRLRRLPPPPPHGADRLHVPRRRVAPQGGRARRPRAAPGARPEDAVTDLDAVRRELEARRAGASERVAELAKAPELGEAQGFGKRIGDGTTEAITRLTEIGVGRSLETGLERTERALAKLDEGTYGICDRCGQPIPPSGGSRRCPTACCAWRARPPSGRCRRRAAARAGPSPARGSRRAARGRGRAAAGRRGRRPPRGGRGPPRRSASGEPCGITASIRRSEPPSAMSGSVKPKRSRLLV